MNELFKAALCLLITALAANSRASERFSPEMATATIKGTVSYDGPAIKRPPREVGADPQCAAMHPANDPILSEEVIVTNGKLKNVIIYVKKGAENWTFEIPKQPVVLEQKGCMYVPHVFGVMAGQPIEIVNSDGFAHNVHGTSPGKANPDFNVAQAKKGDDRKVLNEPQLPYNINCDVHRWMKAYVGIFAHPFFAVTGEDGAYEMKLPPGEYEIEAWQESEKKLEGPHRVAVKISDKETKTQDFTFKRK